MDKLDALWRGTWRGVPPHGVPQGTQHIRKDLERSRPNESLLIGPGVEIEAGGHLPGWLDPGSGITAAPFGSLLRFHELTELGPTKKATTE